MLPFARPSSNAPSRLCVAALLLTASAMLPSRAHDTWVARTNVIQGGGQGSSPSRAVYAGGRFLLFSNTSAYWHSAAGTAAWTVGSLPTPPSFFSTRGFASGGGNVVVTGSSNTLYHTTAASIEGLPGTPISWTKLNPAIRGSSPDLLGARYLNHQFVVGVAPFTGGGDSERYSEFLTSPDGLTWTSHKIISNTLGGVTFQPRDIAFRPGASPGTGIWVVVAHLTNHIVTLPEDLSSATLLQINGVGDASMSSQRIVYAEDPGLFVLVTGHGRIYTSSNGTTWTQRSTPAGLDLRLHDVFHDGERFVVVGGTKVGITPAHGVILHSTDGITWTEADEVPAEPSLLEGVIRADGLWLATGPSRTVVTSGSASVSLPEITGGPTATQANVGDTVTLTATVTGSPTPTIEWRKDNVVLSDGPRPSGAIVSGATTSSLTLSGITLAEAGQYMLRATNSVSTTNSNQVQLAVALSANGAVLTPYGLSNTGGGQLIPGASPAKSVIGTSNLALFTVGSGITYPPNTFVNPVFYSQVGGTNPSGTKVLMGASGNTAPLLVYDLATETGDQIPLPGLPLGPISSMSMILPGALADNGDFTGILRDNGGQNHAFHYAAATETYTLLGNVPNAGNDPASNPGGISADGQSVSGYERTGVFDGAFVWTTSEGFTLLPDPPGGAANGDVRGISPNGRWIVGYGSAPSAYGGGQTALRWDRGSPFGPPTARALPKRTGDSFADAFSVNDDGTAGGGVRMGSSFTGNRAAVWLPSGALVVLPDYLATEYGLDLSGFTLNQVTSISADRRTLAGTATNAANQTEGWILTLPDPVDLGNAAPDIAVRVAAGGLLNHGAPLAMGMNSVASPSIVQQILYLRNDGTAALTGLSASIVGTNAADFTYLLDEGVPGIPTTLEVGEYLTLYVRFAPQPGPDGPRSATLRLSSNDPDENPFDIVLGGMAASPSMIAFTNYLVAASVPSHLRGELADADNDGLSNVLEFALGLSPGQSSTMPEARIVGDHLELTYTRAQQTHAVYEVEASGDLAGGPWSGDEVDQGTPDGDGVTTARIPLSTGKGFLRLRVSLAP